VHLVTTHTRDVNRDARLDPESDEVIGAHADTVCTLVFGQL
jgi:hypothetical protein